MKRFLIFAAMLAVAACSKEQSVPAEVTVKLDYNLPESGSMSRGGAELYQQFYDEQIATRKLTPSTYTLTFTNTADQSTVTITDQWAKGHALKLLSGTYKVKGTSASVEYDYKGGIDTLYLSFDEEIAIDAATSKITLNAKYDSFMVFFDTAGISNAQFYFADGGNYGTKHTLAKAGSIYYFFIPYIKNTTDKILIERTSGEATINLKPMTFEKGKYYYFGDLSSEYNLPTMDGGN